MNTTERDTFVRNIQTKVSKYKKTCDPSNDRLYGFIDGLMMQQWTKFADSCTIVNEDMNASAIKWDDDGEFILYHL